MNADFSKIAAHLAANLEAHADRDGLTGVRRAIFLDRGRHAPGDVCPSEQPSPAGEAAWCFSCERMHEPMEWGDGCTDSVGEGIGYWASHHRIRSRVAGHPVVARPVRDTSRWRRWKRERACECSAETDGMPKQECKACIECAGGER